MRTDGRQTRREEKCISSKTINQEIKQIVGSMNFMKRINLLLQIEDLFVRVDTANRNWQADSLFLARDSYRELSVELWESCG